MNNISAIIISFNEINHIQEVIKNISFADEIIVVDSYSHDGTFEKLEEFKHITKIQRKFKNFADQRNFALKQAHNDWILFIDADERITSKLKNEILHELKRPQNNVAFLFKRSFFFKNKRIRFSGFQSDKTYRLFKNGYVKYQEDKIVHEMPLIKGESKVLKNKMLHYSFENAQHYKRKMETYAALKALELYKQGRKATILHFIFRPVYKFVTNYIIRLGILDGKEGFQLCYLSAYAVYYRYRKLNQLTKTSPKK